MYRSSASDTPRDTFLDQFEWDGGDWLYRFKMTGAAYRVTDAEKDAFVATFDRQQRLFLWIGLPLTLALYILLLWAVYAAPPDSLLAKAKPSLWAGVFLGGAVRAVNDHFAFRVPLRALAQRTPVAPAWSKRERRRLMLDRIPSEVLFGVSIVCVILLAMILVEGGLTSRWGQIWSALFVVFLLWAAIVGFRKWQFSRADAALTSPAT